MTDNTKLTPEQIKNWRKILPAVFGFSDFGLSDEDIQKLRDKIQAEADKGDSNG